MYKPQPALAARAQFRPLDFDQGTPYPAGSLISRDGRQARPQQQRARDLPAPSVVDIQPTCGGVRVGQTGREALIHQPAASEIRHQAVQRSRSSRRPWQPWGDGRLRAGRCKCLCLTTSSEGPIVCRHLLNADV